LIVIPAIDLKDGNCVRLLQGDFDRSTVYSRDPVDIALRWKEEGAERLHVVDLDGSRAGRPVNGGIIARIVRETGLPVELGGGIRNMETLKACLDTGVRWAILGTAAWKNPDFVFEACSRFPGSIMVGIDAKDGRLLVEAWMEDSGQEAFDVAGRYDGSGIAAIVFTDTKRDGMETGVNVESTRMLAEAVRVPVIASGGVSTVEDVRRLREVESSGICGVIIGKALYTGAVSLEEAIRAGRA
jgi:phosphoribosylformimino-5-aminoimidazole carboxamide ribotide isomerase